MQFLQRLRQPALELLPVQREVLGVRTRQTQRCGRGCIGSDWRVCPISVARGARTTCSPPLLFVPDVDRSHLLRQLTDRTGVVGQARPWTRVSASYARAARARSLSSDIRDTEDHLPELVLSADVDAFADLCARALAMLRTVPDATARQLDPSNTPPADGAHADSTTAATARPTPPRTASSSAACATIPVPSCTTNDAPR